MAKRPGLFSPNKFDIHGLSTCMLFALVSTMLLPAYTQSKGTLENKPEYVTLLISDLEAQPSGADFEEAQSNSPSQQTQETADPGDVYGLVVSILIIAGVAAIGMGMKRLFRKKKRDERHEFRRRR